MRRRKSEKRKHIGCWVIVVILLLVVWGFAGSRILSVSRYEVHLSKLPQAFDGARVVHIADLHNQAFGPENEWLLNRIHSLNPDLVVVPGDIVSSGDISVDQALELMRGLASRVETLFISGNHEQIRSWVHETEHDFFLGEMETAGVIILDNAHYQWHMEGESVHVAGFVPPAYFHADAYGRESAGVSMSDPEPLLRALGVPREPLQFLLAHNPDYLSSYAAWGADLVFSGHIHGGVIRLPFVGGVLSPSREWFPQYDAGLFKEEDTQMVVTRGLGNSVIPFRLFNPPDISLIVLRTGEVAP